MYAVGGEVVPLRSARPGARQGWLLRPWQALVVLAVTGALLLGLARSAHGEPAARYETVLVQPGDTLWAIAAARYPNSDVRQKIDDIESANRLSGPSIRAGQELRVPAG
jgi:nucleoid-associated protein YgaU